MLIVVWCLLCVVVRCLLFVDRLCRCRVLIVVCGLLFALCDVLFVVCWLLLACGSLVVV